MSLRMQSKKKERKKAILNAALKIVVEKGTAGMTMELVAREADVATGTLYLYFKNKGSLLAAVNAQINGELNDYIKEKSELCKTGLEKVISMGQATVEFFLGNPEKWNALTELYQMKIQDPEDPNVQEFIDATDDMVQMMAEAYRQGIKEGTIREDLNPVATSIYNRMAWSNAFTPTNEQNMLLKRNKINQKEYLSVAGELISRSTRKVIPEEYDNQSNVFDKDKNPE